MSKYEELIGILGGLGPKASAEFYGEYLINGRVELHKKMIKLNDTAKKNLKNNVSSAKWTKSEIINVLEKMGKEITDQDHPPILMMSASNTPDRTKYLFGETDENPTKYLANSAEKLVKGGATKICIPCNTAHYYLPELKEELKKRNCSVPILNMIELTVQLISKSYKLNHSTKQEEIKVGLLSTTGTVRANIYKICTQRLGVEYENIKYLYPEASGKENVMKAIHGAKAGETDLSTESGLMNMFRLLKEIKSLKNKGCQFLILGCTELPIFISKQKLQNLKQRQKEPKVVELMKAFDINNEDIVLFIKQKDFKLINPGIVLADEVLKIGLISRI